MAEQKPDTLVFSTIKNILKNGCAFILLPSIRLCDSFAQKSMGKQEKMPLHLIIYFLLRDLHLAAAFLLSGKPLSNRNFKIGLLLMERRKRRGEMRKR